MNNRDLIKKLSNLREIKPDDQWLKTNRETLFAQISNSGAADLNNWSSFVINLKSFMKTASMPAMALSSLMLVLLGSSVFTHSLFNKTKPNESLYIARIISEKAKLNTILNSEVREKKAVEFAINHAQDITEVLATPTFTNEVEIAKLNASFKEEIKTVKTNIARLAKTPVKDKAAATSSDKAVSGEEVFVATALKDETGVSLKQEELSSVVASSTTSTEQILEQASNLFEQKNYSEAAQVLESIK